MRCFDPMTYAPQTSALLRIVKDRVLVSFTFFNYTMEMDKFGTKTNEWYCWQEETASVIQNAKYVNE